MTIVIVTAPGLSGQALETFNTMRNVWQTQNPEIGQEDLFYVQQRPLTGTVTAEYFESLEFSVSFAANGDIILSVGVSQEWSPAQLGELFNILDSVTVSGNVSSSGASIITLSANGTLFGAQAALTYASGVLGWELGAGLGGAQFEASVGLTVTINVSAAAAAVQQGAVDTYSTLGFIAAAQLGLTQTYMGVPVQDPESGPTWEEIIMNWLNNLASPLAWRIPAWGD